MKIVLTDLAAKRHFNPNFNGTKITDFTPEQFEFWLNSTPEYFKKEMIWKDGYADFCKHLFVNNLTSARMGTAEITDENRSNLRSGYKARRDSELPVLSRWFEGSGAYVPIAKYLDLILYSKEQLEKEGTIINADYGIVAILSSMTPDEAPMPPATMIRNALGISEGGSGHPLNREEYMKSVEYWSTHALVGS